MQPSNWRVNQAEKPKKASCRYRGSWSRQIPHRTERIEATYTHDRHSCENVKQGSDLSYDTAGQTGCRRSNKTSQEHNSVGVEVGRYRDCCRHRQHHGNTVARLGTTLLFGQNQSATSYIVL